ncbi:MAG: ribonuclease D [Rhodospirillales bacterium]|nr:ribonuclease D [Rhodospirillales bacterium]
MIILKDTESLAQFCDSLTGADFVTVDTEFMRERTYWPELCLVQLGGPDEAAIVDPLAKGIDLSPLFKLVNDEPVLKVFHAARQDLEIFHHLTGKIPTPIFDTQVAGMVCGFGESVGYETLVAKLVKTSVDKSMRFTDWSRRPLSEKQLQYALSDVTHLRVAYEKLALKMKPTNRHQWVEDEMAILNSPNTYLPPPEDAWRRIKFRGNRPRFICVLRELAALRERMARERNVPRNRIMRDDMILDIAARAPETADALAQTRSVGRSGLPAALTSAILEAVARGKAIPEADCPVVEKKAPLPHGTGPLMDLLKVLLKMKCVENGVAQKLVASSAELEKIAAAPVGKEPDSRVLTGWRRELFGEDALQLKTGRLALSAKGSAIQIIPLQD